MGVPQRAVAQAGGGKEQGVPGLEEPRLQLLRGKLQPGGAHAVRARLAAGLKQQSGGQCAGKAHVCGIHARGGERRDGPLPEWVLSQLGQKRGAPALRGTGLCQHGGIPAEARPKAFRVSQRGVRVQCQQNLTQAVDGMLWNHGTPPFWSFPVF